MLNRRYKYLQIAFNRSLEEVKGMVEMLPSSDRIIIEAGTPFVKKYGMSGISSLKNWWNQKTNNNAYNLKMLTEIIKAVILGVVEGLTEFIPVSSTGHLILAEHWLSFRPSSAETFAIAIQLGAILAVLLLYRSIFASFFQPKNWFKRDMNNI